MDALVRRLSSGLGTVSGAYRHLDVMPKGRDENGPYHTLAEWVRPRNTYGKAGMVEGNGRYHAPGCARATHR